MTCVDVVGRRLSARVQPDRGSLLVDMPFRSHDRYRDRVSSLEGVFFQFSRELPGSLVLDVTWDVDEATTTFPVQVTVIGHDRVNLLADISRAIGEFECNIQSGTFEGANDYARCSFMVEVRNLHHLDQILSAIRRLPDVTRVDRAVFSREEPTEPEPEP